MPHRTRANRSPKQIAWVNKLNARRAIFSSGVPKTHRLWGIWNGLRNRCNNPNSKDYARYGGAGIKCCRRWNHFINFFKDMGAGYAPGLQIDRKNGSKGYSKSNCRWATVKEQQRNRKSNKLVDTPKGKMLLIEASEVFGIPYGCLKMRRHWPAHRLLEPKRPHVRRK